MIENSKKYAYILILYTSLNMSFLYGIFEQLPSMLFSNHSKLFGNSKYSELSEHKYMEIQH